MIDKLDSLFKKITMIFISILVGFSFLENLGFKLGSLGGLIFILTILAYLLVLVVLAGARIYRAYKKDRLKLVWKLGVEFLGAFLLVNLVSYLKTKKLNLAYSLVFSLILILVSFFVESKLREDRDKE